MGPAGRGDDLKIRCDSCGAEVDHWRWSCDSCGAGVEPRIGFTVSGEEAAREAEARAGCDTRGPDGEAVEGEGLHRRLSKSLLVRIAITVLIVAVLVSALLLLAKVRRGAGAEVSPRGPLRTAGSRLPGPTTREGVPTHGAV